MTKTSIFSERTLKRGVHLVCYLSLPLLMLLAMTFLVSWLVTGGVNTNVNDTDDFITVFLSFSLPMIVALAAVPLMFKLRHRSCAELGLRLPEGKISIAACVLMAIGTVVLTLILSQKQGLEVSAWTVWTHFFFVAVAEEIMLRSIIADELRYFTRNRFLLCLINGLIFAFVYHSNDDFLPNLMVRVPLGFVLCMVREKSGNVYPAIMLHWLYNMFVTTI